MAATEASDFIVNYLANCPTPFNDLGLLRILSNPETAAIHRDTILRTLEIEYIGWLLTGAAVMFVLWDQILSLPREIRLVWHQHRSRWSYLTYVLIWHRTIVPLYLIWSLWIINPFRNPIPSTMCKIWMSASLFLGFGTVGSLEWMLVLRASALYANKRITLALRIGFVLCFLTIIGVITHTVVLFCRGQFKTICPTTYAKMQAPISMWAWVVLGAFDLTVFSLTLFRIVKIYISLRETHKPLLIRTLLRDGTVWFVLTSVTNILNYVVFLQGLQGYQFAGIFGMWSFFAVAFCRLYLGLKDAASVYSMGQASTRMNTTWIIGVDKTGQMQVEHDWHLNKRRVSTIDDFSDDLIFSEDAQS